MFKTKQTKKKYNIDNNLITTLDKKHNEFIDEFNTNEKVVIPKLKNEKNILLKKLNNHKEIKSIDDKIFLEDKLNEVNEKIKLLKNKKKKYYLKNSKYIFEYFENKKNINEKSKNIINQSKSKIIGDFFKIKNDNEDIILNNKQNKNIVKSYLSNISDNYIDMSLYTSDNDLCEYCKKGELIVLEDEGVLLCNSCFKNVPYLVENEKPSYKEPPKEVCFYAYKKINHFKEILSQFQGKETTQIPDEIIENIKQQIKKERIQLKELNHTKIKEILKKLNYNNYYEHIAFIKNKLGIKPITMSYELEETLCNLFIELQAPYSKHVPDYRVNFLNYHYVLYKLCELLGETLYLEHIPMLKDRVKIIEQDMIWFKMCKTLNWEYIQTI